MTTYTHYSNKTLFYNKELVNTKVQLRGWVRNRRDSKAGFSFITVHDGSCFAPVQAIANKSLTNYDNEILSLNKDCSVIINGTLVASQGKGQSIEIQADKVEVIGWIEKPESYPISAKRHTVEHLRKHSHLRVRTNLIGAISRVRNTVANELHNFFNDNGYMWVNTPILTTNDCEGAGELFNVSTLDMLNIPIENDKVDYTQDFFGRDVFLTVSGQLNVETYCCALSKVYTFGPTFRAENSNTSRHLAEFWMVEPELAFANLDDVIKLAEKMLKTVIANTMQKHTDDFEFFNKFVQKGVITKLENVINKDFVRLEYAKAIDILQNSKKKFEFPVEWGIDLQSEHERYLCEEHFHAPVVLTNYPKNIKAFYMRMNDDGKTVAAMDILVPGIGELIGGSQREERLDVLDSRMIECGIDANSIEWYRDIRKYGTVPHGGFGLGFERFINYITGVANIRDVIPFPRVKGSANY